MFLIETVLVLSCLCLTTPRSPLSVSGLTLGDLVLLNKLMMYIECTQWSCFNNGHHISKTYLMQVMLLFTRRNQPYFNILNMETYFISLGMKQPS